LGKKSAGQFQDLVGPAQFVVLALQFLHTLRFGGSDAVAHAHIDLHAFDPFIERLRYAANLGAMDSMAAHSEGYTDIEGLSHIMRAEVEGTRLTAGALGGELGLTSGATTFLMSRLKRAGLIKRTRDVEDQRKVCLRLSAAGRKLAHTIYPAVDRLSQSVMDQFTSEELSTVQRFLANTTTAMATYRASFSMKQHRDRSRGTGRSA
jgi:DNA-binding MarR family transcriptional regulator